MKASTGNLPTGLRLVYKHKSFVDMRIYDKIIKYFIFLCVYCMYVLECVLCKRIFVYVSARVFLPNCRPIFTRSSQAHTVAYTYVISSNSTIQFVCMYVCYSIMHIAPVHTMNVLVHLATHEYTLMHTQKHTTHKLYSRMK